MKAHQSESLAPCEVLSHGNNTGIRRQYVQLCGEKTRGEREREGRKEGREVGREGGKSNHTCSSIRAVRGR